MKRTPQPLPVLAVSLLLAGAALAQEGRQRPMPPGIEDLPIGLAPGERVPSSPGPGFTTSAPAGPVRAAAEWDESRGVFSLWDNASLMAELQKDGDVHIITQNPSWWLSWLGSQGIPTTNFHFLNAATDTWWVRDYGPWYLWDGDQSFGLLDYTYNRPRPKDNAIPAAVSAAYGIPYHAMDLVHTGGNYYADGYGNAWSTDLVFTENPTKTEEEVRAIMQSHLGITRYVAEPIKVTIEHFDTFGKLLAPDTLLWGIFPENSTAWVYTEAALAQFEKLQSPYGWPYEIHRIPLWPQGSSWTAYVNSLQTQDKIVVAAHGGAYDAQAKAIYEQAAPGYEIAMVSAGGTTWGDSVHCRTRNLIRGDGLRIYAQPHWKRSDDAVLGYPVLAEVIPPPGTALSGPPTILWTDTGGAPFQREIMAPTGAPHEYEGTIPAAPHGTLVSYYIEARDGAGNVRRAPSVAPRGTFTIEVAQDLTPPQLEHYPVGAVMPSEWPLELTCTALDDTGIPAVTLEYAVNGVPWPPVTMTKDEGTFVFRGTTAGSVALGDLVSYRIVATDHASPPNSIASPQQGWHYLPVQERRSVLVVELDPTPSSGEAWLGWCTDLGLDAQLVTSWPATLGDHDLVVVCLGMFPTHANLSSWQANALTGFLAAGGAAFVEGGNAWSQGSSSIYRSWFGLQSASNGALLSPPILGAAGALTAGMSFGYEGEKGSSDHMGPAPGTQAILSTGSSVKAVKHSTGTYRAAGASFQLGGLTDAAAPTRAKYLAGLLLQHLGMGVQLVVTPDPADALRLTFDLEGEAGRPYAIFGSPETGYASYGPAGILRLERAVMQVLSSGNIPAGGRARIELTLPPEPGLFGSELHFQAFVRDGTPIGYHLTNPDRVTIGQ